MQKEAIESILKLLQLQANAIANKSQPALLEYSPILNKGGQRQTTVQPQHQSDEKELILNSDIYYKSDNLWDYLIHQKYTFSDQDIDASSSRLPQT